MMRDQAQALAERYYLPNVPTHFFGVPEHRTYTLSPRANDRDSLLSNVTIELRELRDFTKGHYTLIWTTDWDLVQFIEMINRFVYVTQQEGKQTRFERELQNRETGRTILDFGYNTEYGQRLYERARAASQNKVIAVLTKPRRSDSYYDRFDSFTLQDSPITGQSLSVTGLRESLARLSTARIEEASICIGLDICKISYEPVGFDNPCPNNLNKTRALVKFENFGCDALFDAMSMFAQSDVPEAERHYFLNVISEAVWSRVDYQSRFFQLEELRGRVTRRYDKARIECFGWDGATGSPKRTVVLNTDAASVYSSRVYVANLGPGLVLAIDLHSIVLVDQMFDYLVVRYQSNSTPWRSRRVYLPDILAILNAQNKYRNYERLRLYLSNQATLSSYYLNVLDLGIVEIPDQLDEGIIERIELDFYKSRPFIVSTNDDEQERRFRIEQNEGDDLRMMSVSFTNL